MRPLTSKETLGIEADINDVVSSIRALVRADVAPEAIVFIGFHANVAAEHLGREDYCRMLAVAMWMLAKTEGPVDDA